MVESSQMLTTSHEIHPLRVDFDHFSTNSCVGFDIPLKSHKMRFMKWLSALFFIFFVCSTCLGAEQRIAFETSYFVDAQGNQTIESIQDKPFTIYHGDLRLGYIDQPIWVQIKIAPVFDNLSFQANPLKLRIGPYFIDRIEKYEFLNHAWERVVKGATLKENNDACFEDAHCFKLFANPSLSNVVYMKLQTRGVIFLNTDVMDSEHMAALNIQKVRGSSFSIALATIFLLSAVLFFIFRPSYLVFSYVCLQLAIVFQLLYAAGLVTSNVEFLSPLNIKQLSYYLTCLRALLLAQLIFAFLKPYQLNKTYSTLLTLVFVFTAFDFTLIALGRVNQALQFQLCIHLFNIFIQIYGFYTCDFKSKSIKNLLLISTVSYLCLFLYGVSNVMGWFEIKAPFVLQSYSNLNGTFVGLLLLLVGMYENRRQQLAKEAEIENLKFQTFQAQLNDEKHRERSSLMDILTHELMNPLSAIKFAVASLKRNAVEEDSPVPRLHRIESSVERMKNLIEQVSLSNRLESHEISYPLERIHALTFVEDLIEDYADPSRFDLQIESDIYFFSNAVLLGHILKNLIENAYKYDSRLDKINLKILNSSNLEPSDRDFVAGKELVGQDLIFIQISNSFEASQKPDGHKIFNRYYRQENVMTKPGMGIGLSIVKTALEKLGGHIQFSMAADRAIFKLVL